MLKEQKKNPGNTISRNGVVEQNWFLGIILHGVDFQEGVCLLIL